MGSRDFLRGRRQLPPSSPSTSGDSILYRLASLPEPPNLLCPNCGVKVFSHPQYCPLCKATGQKSDPYCCEQCQIDYWPIHKYAHEPSDDAPKSVVLFPSFKYSGNVRPYTLGPVRDFPAGSDLKPPPNIPNTVARDNHRTSNDLFVANSLARQVMNEVANSVTYGITTASLEKVVHEACIDRNCYPALLGHKGFPRSCSTSINEVVCGGIPDLRELENGDILNVDVNVFYQGYYGCVSETFVLGDNVSKENRRLVRAAYECCHKAIQMIKPNVKYQTLVDNIVKYADSNGFSVILEEKAPFHTTFYPLLQFFEEPEPPQRSTSPSEDGAPAPKNRRLDGPRVMQQGDVFTIAPILTYGDTNVIQWPDKSIATQSGMPVAQFKQTVRVNGYACDILTENMGEVPYFINQFEQYYPDEPLKTFKVFEN